MLVVQYYNSYRASSSLQYIKIALNYTFCQWHLKSQGPLKINFWSICLQLENTSPLGKFKFHWSLLIVSWLGAHLGSSFVPIIIIMVITNTPLYIKTAAIAKVALWGKGKNAGKR